MLAKDEANRPRLAAVLYNLCETLRFAATLLQPFMPQTAPKMAAQLGLDASELTYDALDAFGSHATYTVHKGEALFPRIDAEKELEELRMEEEKNRAAAAAAAALRLRRLPKRASPSSTCPKSPLTISARWSCAWPGCLPVKSCPKAKNF